MLSATTLQRPPVEQPYAVCTGCWPEQLFAPVMLQYWEQVAGVQLPLHQTWLADVAYWVCGPGLLVGQALFEPSQLLYVLVALQAPLVPDHVVLPEQRVDDATLESAGHAWALQVSATSQAPALALQVKPSRLDQAVVLTAVLQIWQEFPPFTSPLL